MDKHSILLNEHHSSTEDSSTASRDDDEESDTDTPVASLNGSDVYHHQGQMEASQVSREASIESNHSFGSKSDLSWNSDKFNQKVECIVATTAALGVISSSGAILLIDDLYIGHILNKM